MQDVKDMTAEQLWDAHIHYAFGSDEELLARLRGYDAIIEDITSLCDTQWKLHHNGLAPAVIGTMKRAIQSAREVKS
jgi:hypothetical protein